MEIQNQAFIDSSFPRYSVIVHEYFHTYQKSLNQHMNKPNADPTSFDTKLLIEGTAAAVEGMYAKQCYGISYNAENQNVVHDDVFTSPSKFESYDVSGDIDTNYSSSIFLILVLTKELQILVNTEDKFFRLILQDYMAANPNKATLKTLFTDAFNMTVDGFYSKFPNYYGQ